MSNSDRQAGMVLRLPQDWKQGCENITGPFGTSERHVWAVSPDCKVEFDVSEGEMPQDSTAPDQALTNYVEMVGFDDDDPEDYNPILQWNFNNRKAYGFQVYCDDESQIRVMCQEHHRGRLAVISIQAPSDSELEQAFALLEKSLRF